ncbi:MAG: plastocyanin/azurin family copper-binding protein [Dehalococcoidia bacterium]
MIRAARFGGIALVVGTLATAAAVLAAAGGSEDPPVTSAKIGVHFSKFIAGNISVPVGTPITFTLVNQDPIEHEWIVGDDAVHARHRTGTEPYHDEIPTEVTLRAYETKTTVITFDTPGEFKYICHLPGHEEYGMVGTIKVVASN